MEYGNAYGVSIELIKTKYIKFFFTHYGPATSSILKDIKPNK